MTEGDGRDRGIEGGGRWEMGGRKGGRREKRNETVQILKGAKIIPIHCMNIGGNILSWGQDYAKKCM